MVHLSWVPFKRASIMPLLVQSVDFYLSVFIQFIYMYDSILFF